MHNISIRGTRCCAALGMYMYLLRITEERTYTEYIHRWECSVLRTRIISLLQLLWRRHAPHAAEVFPRSDDAGSDEAGKADEKTKSCPPPPLRHRFHVPAAGRLCKRTQRVRSARTVCSGPCHCLIILRDAAGKRAVWRPVAVRYRSSDGVQVPVHGRLSRVEQHSAGSARAVIYGAVSVTAAAAAASRSETALQRPAPARHSTCTSK